MNARNLHPADQLISVMQRIYSGKLTTTSGGNLSIRGDNGDIWITPAGIDKGTLTRKDIICVHPDGSWDGPHRPSSEYPFHASVFKRCPTVGAVLHAHSPSIVAFSIARKLPNTSVIPCLDSICGRLAMAPYALPGSAELGEKIGAEFDKGADTVLLENHGVCIGAKDIFEAYRMFETLEYAASLSIAASKLGGKPTSPDFDTMAALPCAGELPCELTAAERGARRDMVDFIRRSVRQGLFGAALGSCSVRLGEDSFLITPAGLDRAFITEEDLVRVDNGSALGGEAEAEAALHRSIYRKHPDVNAVMLARPLHVMAFGVTDTPFDPRTIPESYILLRDVKKVDAKLIRNDPDGAAALFAPAQPALLFANDCLVTLGSTLLQAFDRLEVAEATAHSIVAARDVGDIVHIASSEIDDLKVDFKLPD
ncbi:MAG: class II aldolase/adducin family protein [Clostridia bacterium]|nr:class II aldolase/adducin family protein [Clostridia bacterium]